MFHADYFLKKHGIVLDTNKSVEEQTLQMTVGFGVQDSESGDRPYIFVSYAHKDSAVVLPAIKALQDCGYPIWYDAGIRPGTTWSDYIADHVRNAALVIAFMSKNAIASQHCQSEIRYAFNNGRPMLTVRLDQSELPSGLDMQLSQWQMFPAHRYDGDTYLTKLAEDDFIASTAGAALETYMQEKHRQEAEAERQRKEKEEEVRKCREAEQAARKQKEAEELERVRIAVEAAEELQRKRTALARMRREAEEAERKRREEAEADIRRLMEEEADLERQNDVAQRNYGDFLEAKKKYQEAKDALEVERMLREEAEQKHKFAEEQIRVFRAELELIKEKSNTPSSEDERKQVVMDTYYHLAQAFERKKDFSNAYLFYHSLPNSYRDVSKRKETIKKDATEQNTMNSIMLSLLFLAANFFLIKSMYNEEASAWIKVLLHSGPMLLVTLIWGLSYICTVLKYLQEDSMIKGWIILHIGLPIIAFFADAFLYPGTDILYNFSVSFMFNLMSALVCIWISLRMMLNVDYSKNKIIPIQDK